MPSIDDLGAAGARAAQRSVPSPPSIDTLAAEVASRRTRTRRVIGSTVAVAALAIGIPVAAAQIGNDDAPPSVFTAAQDGELDAAVADETASEAPTTTAPASDEPDPSADPSDKDDSTTAFGLYHEGDHDFRVELGDLAFSIKVLEGEGASDAAAAAADEADETREVDGVTVWVKNESDTETSVSAFVDDEVFIEVTGPAESIDSLLELATKDWPKVEFGPLPDFEKFFPEDGTPPFDLEEIFPEGELPPLLDLDEFFSEPGRLPDGFGLPPLEELLPPEVLDELKNLEPGEGWGTFKFGDPEDLDELGELIPPELRERLESGEPWGFFDGNDVDDLFKGTPFEEFEGCLDITIEETESGFSIEVPDCELFEDGQFFPDFDVEDLFPDVDEAETAVNT